MVTTAAELNDWVVEEMQTLDLGDHRLEERARKILRDFSQHPTASIPEFCEDWAATKAAYNFFNHAGIEAQAVRAAQRHATLKRMQGQALVLALQDTTSFDFRHHPAMEGTGPLDNVNGQGFLAHTTLATTPDGVPLGVLAQAVWVRDAHTLGKRHQRKQRPLEDKESFKWLQGLDASSQDLPPGVRILEVSDRESDVFEYFAHARPEPVDLLVRASWDRRLVGEAGNLWLTVRNSPVRGKVEVAVGRRPDQVPRTAVCQVYYHRVKVRPPSHRPAHLPKLEPLVLWAVLIEETHAPAGVEPLSWLLLTTLPVADFDQACQIITYYTQRWIIERFHFVLKSGCGVEQRQLQAVSSLERFLVLANVVAWRLLWLTYLGRATPDVPCRVALADYEWKALYCFIHKTAVAPNDPPSLQAAIRWIAQLGGFLGRKSDGEPGVKVLWRGWRRLLDISETWSLFNTS